MTTDFEVHPVGTSAVVELGNDVLQAARDYWSAIYNGRHVDIGPARERLLAAVEAYDEELGDEKSG
jgi:hypothetical protein